MGSGAKYFASPATRLVGEAVKAGIYITSGALLFYAIVDTGS